MGDTITATDSPEVWDELYRILAVHRRRRVLDALRRTTGGTTVDELVARLAETAASGDTPPDRTQLRLELSHVDLPMLDEAGLVDRNPESGRVSLTGRARALPLFSALQNGLVGTPLRTGRPSADVSTPDTIVEEESD
ncbi:hypothetical protein ACFPYI_08780 [Halomarina salina]|uniref:DUF7344 domain-containing protein n=1 Tax=Halomarina salina TaxID=1872699 RepID=A0ABD5RLJ5_9EURY|nr:hypothetical protein [Halomarina salina]